MVNVDLDTRPPKPADLAEYKCRLCGRPLPPPIQHHWVYDRWLHPTTHPKCGEAWSAKQSNGKQKLPDLPERFAHFDARLANNEAARAAGAFSPQSKVKTLVIQGLPGKGKSRLLWSVVEQFFGELGHGWVEAFLFETLIADYDKAALMKIASNRYVLVDDIGSCESYGRERAGLQAALRSRIKRGDLWSFLTVDANTFDPGLEDICKDRALVVTL
jgi:hypothetical protein